MTRRTAAQRRQDLSDPDHAEWPPTGEALAAAIAALAHPRRRQLVDHLVSHGPASVGVLARSAQMAVGSASYHLGVLARAGFIAPAPHLAGDTRESWWRAASRSLQWSEGAFASGSAGQRLTQLASQANLDYLLTAVQRWRRTPAERDWDGTVSDALTLATTAQSRDLGRRLATVMAEWAAECRADLREHPEAPRRPIRAVARVPGWASR